MKCSIGEWSCWTDWTECSVSCGIGYKQRSRQCVVVNNKGVEGSGCEGSALAQEPCEMPTCECKSSTPEMQWSNRWYNQNAWGLNGAYIIVHSF